MTNKTSYKEEIWTAIGNMKREEKDEILREALELLLKPETRLESLDENDYARIAHLEMAIDRRQGIKATQVTA